MIKKTKAYKKLVKKKAKKKSKKVDSDGYKKQLVGNKKMPKAVGNHSLPSILNERMNLEKYDHKKPEIGYYMDKGIETRGHYAPTMKKTYFDKDGGGQPTQKNQTNEAQKKKLLASRKKKRKRLTPSKPQKGYKAPTKGYTSGSY